MNSFPMNESDVQAGTTDMDIADEVEEQEDGEIKESSPPLPAEPSDTEQMMPPPPAANKSDDVVEEMNLAPSTVNDSLIDFIINRDDAAEDEGKQNGAKSVPVETSKSVLVSKQVVEGTPLLKSASSFDKLPEGDKWSVGVSDVINFENLPDSVGKYEKMKLLLKKVGSAVRQINNE